MVFPGRARGRGFGAKGGGIHATTRKSSSSSFDRSRYRDHDRSLSPPRKRPTTVEDRLGTKHSREETSPPTESLRITVGNDIYSKEAVDSPLSERLGPPVQPTQNTADIFEQERMLYGEGADNAQSRNEKWRQNSQERRYDDSHGRSDSRGRDRRRDSSRERRDHHGGSRDRHGDRRDHRRDSRDYYNRREGSRERHRSDSYSSHYDRREDSRDRDYRDYHRGGPNKQFDERFSSERLESHYGDRARHDSGRFDSLPHSVMERGLGGPNSPVNYYRGTLESLTQPVMRSPPKAEPTPPTAKPLKSILKKKTNSEPPPVIPPGEVSQDPYRIQMDHRLGPPPRQDFNSERPPAEPAMDIEDEERFLYGEAEKTESSTTATKQPLWTQPFAAGLYQPPGSGTQQCNTFPVLGQQRAFSPPSAYTQEKPPDEPERQYDSSDLLSIFTKRPQPRVIEDVQIPPTQPPTQPPIHQTLQPLTEQPTQHTRQPPSQQPASFAVTMQEEVKQQKYDPTIENILKSIGFDFEMSKRMQEKAGSEVKKEELPQEYGINQTASFLGGGLSTEDLTSNLFSKKKPALDILSSREGQDFRPDRGSTEGRPSFLDQILRRDQHNKTNAQIPLSEPSMPPSVTQEFPSTTYAIPSFSQGYAAPAYTAPYAPPATSAVDPYSYHSEYSTAQSQYPPTVSAYSAPEKQREPMMRQLSPGLPKAPEMSTRENLTPIPLEENLRKSQMHEPSKKKNIRPNLREIPKSSESLRTKPSENPSFSSRTVLPPKSESSQFQKQGGKRPVERESAQSSIQSRKQAEKLQRDKEERQKRILALEEELTKLRRQQNEIMRKKRRQKDGHKDPILLQNSKLQEEIAMQISKLRKIGEGKSVEELQPQQKKNKIDKEEQKVVESVEIQVKGEPKSSPEGQTVKEEATVKEEVTVKEEFKSEPEATTEEKPKQLSFQVKGGVKTRYEFFDPGKHWCKLCNTVYDTAIQFLEHTHFRHNKKWKNTDNYDRPWIPDQMKNPTPKKKAQKTEVVSLKGPEFLFPTNGFFCVLCREFSGDVQCAEFHLKTETHHSNYQKFLQDSPFYEQRRQLDRAKGLAEKQEKTLKDKESKPLFGRNISRERQIAKSMEKNVNIKQSEKEVEELSDIQGSTQSNAAKLAKMKLSLKQPTVTNPVPKPDVEEPSALQTQSSVEESEKTADGEKKEDGKKGIEIRIANKIGIIGKVPAKKNALLPPWTPVSRQEPLKSIAGIEAEKSKPASEKKQVTAQDILKAVQEKKEQERKEMEEKAKQEALLNVMEIPVPQEKPNKTGEIPVSEDTDIKKEKSEDIPVPEEKLNRKENILASEETPSKETRPENTGCKDPMMTDLSAIPVPRPHIPELKDDTNVKNNGTLGSSTTQKPEKNSVASDEGNVKSDGVQKTSETVYNTDKVALENIVLPESVSVESKINNSQSVTMTLTKGRKDPPFPNENQSNLSKSDSLSPRIGDSFQNPVSSDKDVSVEHSGKKAIQPYVNINSIMVTQSIDVPVNIENNQDSNQEPLTADSENQDIDDDKTISDGDDNTIDIVSGDENTQDDQKFRPVQHQQCRPIEDVIDVSMGSLGDVVEVAVGGVGELEGDMDCSVEGLYGVIGGESENLEDVLSVGQGRRGAGCFSDLRPMDVGDMTTGMNDTDVGDIVSELMHSNGMDSDPESEGGLSGPIGSDFEVVDECEEET